MRGSYTQPSFLGGLLSEQYQGRLDDPLYRQSLALSFNGIVLEEGPWVRRPGIQRITPTFERGAAVLRSFSSSTGCSFVLEFANNSLQFYSGNFPIFTNDKRTITASSVVAGKINLTLDANSGWSTTDTVMIFFPVGFSNSEAQVRGRVFQISSAPTNTLVLNDDLGFQYSPASFPASALVGATIMRIARIGTSYTTGLLPNIRVVQTQKQAIILSSGVAAQNLTVVEPTGSNDPTFTLAAANFTDGPYLDPQPGATTISGFTGSITVTPTDGTTFSASDVGRHIRLFSEPAAWNSATTYTYGQTVKYAGSYWQNVINGGGYTNINVPPGTAPTQSNGAQILFWAPAPTAAIWCWGTITAQATTSCTLSLTDNSAQGGASGTIPSANGTTINTWALGLYTSGSYPTVGLFYEGRLWLMGATPNRFDASLPTDKLNYAFSPSDQYGNVNDNNGISYTFNSKENNVAEWMAPDQQGILVGTLGGEWLISAPLANEGLTPTNVEAHQVSSYGSFFAEPKRAGISLLFVQRYQRRVIEYLADAFSGRFGGRHLNEKARHLSGPGIAEIAYQEENQPLLWARMNDGSLAHSTYRRFSRFLTEPPQTNAWGSSQHANGWAVESMTVVPAESGGGDRLYMVVNQGGYRFVEVMRPVTEVTDTIRSAWHLDSAQGNGINGLTKCGGVFPSLGNRSTASWTPSDFSTVVDAGRCLNTPGVSIPVAGSPLRASFFAALANAVYFNGSASVFNFPNLPASGGSFAMSCWLYIPSGTISAGALFQTPLTTAAGLQIGPLPGISSSQDIPAWVTGASGTLSPVYTSLGSGGTWVNVLIASNGTTIQLYFNDTAFTTTGFLAPTGPWQGAVLGGSPQFRLPNNALGGHSAAAGETGASVIPSGGDNGAFIGGMAEFWLKVGSTIDFSIAANRQKFHTTDVAGTTWAPVSLGLHGETPAGATPHVYLTGNPSQFLVNRATGLRVGTFNTNSLTGDSWTGALDPLPSTIVAPT